MKIKPTSCYLSTEEKRAVQEIAEREERPQSRVIQHAVRAFTALYKQDPARARELAQITR